MRNYFIVSPLEDNLELTQDSYYIRRGIMREDTGQQCVFVNPELVNQPGNQGLFKIVGVETPSQSRLAYQVVPSGNPQQPAKLAKYSDVFIISPDIGVRDFSELEEAQEWLDSKYEDGTLDNERFSYLDSKAGMTHYMERYKTGCCGDADHVVRIEGVLAIIGCNFGH